MLDVIVGLEPRGEVTKEAAKYIPEGGYKQFLKEDGLKGKQIGIVRHPFVEMIQGANEKRAFEHNLDLLRRNLPTMTNRDGYNEQEKEAVEKLKNFTENGFEKMMKDHELDAMDMPGSRASPVFAPGGYPAITVPAGYESDGMPFEICFRGLKGTELKLIEIAYAFEQSSKVRRPPSIATCEGSKQAIVLH